MTQPVTWTQQGNALLYSAINPGTLLSASAVETDISPGAALAGQAFPMPFPINVGNYFEVKATGWHKYGAGTVNLGLSLGGFAVKKLAETGTLKPSSVTGEQPWMLDALIFVKQAKGTESVFLTQGRITGIVAPATETAGAAVSMLPKVSKTGGEVTAVDTSSSKVLTMFAKYSEASTNEIQVMTFQVVQIA